MKVGQLWYFNGFRFNRGGFGDYQGGGGMGGGYNNQCKYVWPISASYTDMIFTVCKYVEQLSELVSNWQQLEWSVVCDFCCYIL